MKPKAKVSISSFSFALSLALLTGMPAGAQTATDSPFGNLNPVWLNVFVMTGSPSLGKSVNGLNNSPTQSSIDLELANPVGTVNNIGYFLPFLSLKASSADAQTVSSTPASNASVEQTSYRAVLRYEANPDIKQNPSLAGSFLEFGYLHDPFFTAKALHTLEDATSPSHEGFQSWNQNESPFLILQHCMAERLYPDGDGQQGYRARLEGSVQWGYDIFTGKTPMPAAFFASGTGTLLLPASYLKH